MKKWRVLTEDRSVPPIGTETVIQSRVLDNGLVEWIVEAPEEMQAMSMYCLGVLSVESVDLEGTALPEKARESVSVSSRR